MIKCHGDTADIEAAACADDHLSQGNIEVQRVWLRIAKAIDELRRIPKGEPHQ
jgi:hypothetical protein